MTGTMNKVDNTVGTIRDQMTGVQQSQTEVCAGSVTCAWLACSHLPVVQLPSASPSFCFALSNTVLSHNSAALCFRCC